MLLRINYKLKLKWFQFDRLFLPFKHLICHKTWYLDIL